MSRTVSWIRMAFFIVIPMAGTFAEENPFPVPAIVHPNVAFWKRIYSEVSLNQGLLHDRDYPQIIYETVDVSGKTGTDRAAHIESRKAYYAALIAQINAGSDSARTPTHDSIRALFAAHASESVLVDAVGRIRFQQGQKERFLAGLERSYIHLDTIVSILSAYGVPEQLKYLPHVESSFDPEAYSRVGAAGLWQFMRSTGKLFMKVDYSIDERLDPIRSTVAAAKLLKGNYQKLKSWPLAITAYNHGLGGMQRAVAATGTNDLGVIIQKHESPSFKFASKNFYACFIAASHLADSADVYFPGHARREPFRAKTYAVPAAIKPATLIKQLRISEAEFKALNPSLRPAVYKQQRPIPAGFVVNMPIAAPQPAVTVASRAPETETPEYYTVVKGDNLAAIARRHSVRLEDLTQLNNIGQANKIYIGQVLRLPVTAKTITADTAQPAGIASAVLNSTAKSSVATASQMPSASKDNLPVAHARELGDSTSEEQGGFDAGVYDLGLEIAPGGSSARLRVCFDETVSRYAEWMQVTVESIRRLNELRSDTLRLHQHLQVPIGPESDLKRFEVRRLEYHMALEEDFWSRYRISGTRQIVLKQGENLWHVARREQIPVWLLYRYNRQVDFVTPKPGTLLRIPLAAEKDVHVAPSLTDAQTDTLPILNPAAAEPETGPGGG